MQEVIFLPLFLCTFHISGMMCCIVCTVIYYSILCIRSEWCVGGGNASTPLGCGFEKRSICVLQFPVVQYARICVRHMFFFLGGICCTTSPFLFVSF